MAISERRLLAGAGLLLAILILFLWSRQDPPPPPAPPPAPAPVYRPPTAQFPSRPSAPAPDPSGLRLHGLLAGGAVVGFADGSQRLVPVGREALPGLALRRIEQSYAVFASSAGELRLGFDGASEVSAAAAPAATGPRDETLPYRLGLAPRRAGERVVGFALRPGASLPELERAGIRPGDTILRVNGSLFDEERMLELPWQMANSSRIEFEVERGGRRVVMVLERR